MKNLCSIYRSSRVEGMYLYVDKKEDLARVPEELLATFGKPELAMTLALYPERKLARADINSVLAAIAEQGFYLQMPPQAEVNAPFTVREALTGIAMFNLANYTTCWTLRCLGRLPRRRVCISARILGLTRRWWFELRWLLFALIAVFLLVPAPVPGRTVLAPAMIMAALSPFTGTPGS